MRMDLAVLVCVQIAVGSVNAWSKGPKIPDECSLRDPSLSESDCTARLRHGAPLMPQCANFQGEAYRLCAVHQPSDGVLDQRKLEEQRIREIHLRLDAKLKEANIHLPPDASKLLTPQEAVIALGPNASTEEMYRAYYNARSIEAQAIKDGLSDIVDPDEVQSIDAELEENKRAEELRRNAEKLAAQPHQPGQSCSPSDLQGSSRAEVYACLGPPDHINSDMYADQLVYPNDLFVYLDRGTDKVENVQWTH